ncbi:MAG: alpha/beta fold hydrolase [Pseudomonadota bacterium]
MLLSIDPEGYADACAAVRDADHREALGAVAAPTLVIAGAEDHATPPAMSDILAASLPNARRVDIPGAAHLSNVERPAIFSAHLTTFLASVADNAQGGA